MKCALFFLLLAVAHISGQNPPVAANAPPLNPCPQMELRAPQQRMLKDGELAAYTLVLNGGDPAVVPTLIWTASAGTIVSGQGTRNIRVDTTGAGNDRLLRTEVWVGGYAPQCTAQAASTVQIVGPAIKIAEFGAVTTEKETEELKNFTDALLPSNDTAYVVGYAGRKSDRGYTNVVLKRIKAQLLANGLQYERLALINGGFREEPAIELWIVPAGADAPRASPTVNAREIVYPKTAPIKKP